MAFDREEYEEYVERWSKAIWQSQIDAGYCSTPEPITIRMKAVMRRAAEAAVKSISEEVDDG
jgi:hypothetical protein